MKTLKNLEEIADILLGKNGCPWDKKQTLNSLKKYLLEETNELIEAIHKKDVKNIKEEIGDLLWQLIFIAKLAKIDINKSIKGIYQKLIRRHPHVFEKKEVKSIEDIKKTWEEIKKKEK